MSADTNHKTDASPQDTNEYEREVLMHTIRKLSGRILGTVLGLLVGAGVFIATAALLLKGGEEVGPHLVLLSQFWPGYEVTWLGAFIGLAWGFVTGFVAGWFIGRAYSMLAQWRISRSEASA